MVFIYNKVEVTDNFVPVLRIQCQKCNQLIMSPISACATINFPKMKQRNSKRESVFEEKRRELNVKLILL